MNIFNCPVGLRHGCFFRPILFSLFINELYDLLVKHRTKGIQLHPGITEIFMLMFADDVARISDTVINLQRQLNTLVEFCTEYEIDVNVNKTKVVVFKRGGRLSQKEKWMFDGERLSVVNNFSYVGIMFTNKLCLHKMAENMADKGHRVLMKL